jgi:hypothetical protein
MTGDGLRTATVTQGSHSRCTDPTERGSVTVECAHVAWSHELCHMHYAASSIRKCNKWKPVRKRQEPFGCPDAPLWTCLPIPFQTTSWLERRHERNRRYLTSSFTFTFLLFFSLSLSFFDFFFLVFPFCFHLASFFFHSFSFYAHSSFTFPTLSYLISIFYILFFFSSSPSPSILPLILPTFLPPPLFFVPYF